MAFSAKILRNECSTLLLGIYICERRREIKLALCFSLPRFNGIHGMKKSLDHNRKITRMSFSEFMEQIFYIFSSKTVATMTAIEFG